MARFSPSCHQVLQKQPPPAPPPPTCRRPPPFCGLRAAGPPCPPHSGHIASGQRHSPGSRNSRRLGQRLTHWRTLMKPSGSSSRRQRSPTSRRSTCEGREGQGSGRWGSPGKLSASPRRGEIKVPTPRCRGARGVYLLARRLIRWATRALRRGHAGVAGLGRGAGGWTPTPGGCGGRGRAGSC